MYSSPKNKVKQHSRILIAMKSTLIGRLGFHNEIQGVFGDILVQNIIFSPKTGVK